MTIDERSPPAWASLLHDVASVLASAEAPERRVDLALELTVQALSADRIALYEVVPVLSRELTVLPAASPMEIATLRAELADVARLLTEVPSHREPAPAPAATSMTLPLVGIGEVVGMLRADRREAAFDETHVRVLSGVAALLASYLTVVRTQRELERTMCELRAVYEAGLVGIAFVDAQGAISKLNAPAERIVEASGAAGGAASCDEALRLAEARFAGILRIALDGIVVVDEEQRIVLFNQGAERMFGYSAAEVLGRPLDLLVPERFRAMHHASIAEFARGGPQARPMSEDSVEVVGLRKGGEEFPIEAAISRSEVAGQLLLTAVMRDVTERRRTEHAQRVLVDSAAALGTKLDVESTLDEIAKLGARGLGALSVVYLVGEEGLGRQVRVSVADPSQRELADVVERALGSVSSLPGQRVVETRKPLLLSEIPAGYLEALSASDEMRDALRTLAPSGLIAVPLIARDHCLGALVLFGSAALRRYDERDLQLAQEIGGRAVLALANAVLYAAARDAIRQRDNLLAIVAHDLRSPLNTIRLGATMLRDEGVQAASAHRTLDAMLRAASRAERLISDLLDLHRMRAGTFAITREELPASSLVADAFASQSPIARAAYVELRTEMFERTLWVLADRDRVQQVFDNLIGNAVRFTPAGGRITISLEERDAAVVFRVSDTGPGLTSEEVAHAFDRKWQRPRRERAGAGLGLTICRGIVEAHGGTIGVESTLGKGTTFWFTLPKCTPGRGARGSGSVAWT